MQAKFAELAKTMEAARNTPSVTANAGAYEAQLASMNKLRDGVKALKDSQGNIVQAGVPGFNQMMQATGAWNVQTVKAVSSSDLLTKSLMKGKLEVSQITGNFKGFLTTLKDVANQQEKLRQSTAMQWTSSSTGKSMVDIYTPTSAITSAKTQVGTYLTALRAAGQGVQDWGKNTQWAGRQITAGLVMPVALASAGLIALSKSTDVELTKVVKMYSTQSESISDPFVRAAAKEQELSKVRSDAMQTAIDMAKTYGSVLNDTLETEAQLASKGFTGQGLADMTAQTMKVAQIGSISSNDAMNLVMSASSAFKIKPEGMSDAMNFLNALKNNTNLTMQDISTAIPKIGATIASLVPPTDDANKSLEETGVLLAAFAQGGVPAAQGANAMKTAIARAFDPVPKAVKEFGTLNTQIKEFQGAGGKGIDLGKIKDASGGDPLKFMTDLGKAMQGVDSLSKNTALKDLFGLQQSNRMLIAMNSLIDAQNDPSSQTGKALALAAKGPNAWQDVTDQEVQQFQKSASGKMAIATQTIKAQLVQLGAPLLGFVTPLLNGLGSIVKVVSGLANVLGSLPGPVKGIMKIVGGLALLAGPFMMLVGIGANFVGMLGKVAASIGLLGKNFKILDSEAAADEQLQKTAMQTQDKAAQATASLSLRMKDLVTIMGERMAAQERLNEAIEAGAQAEADAAGAAVDGAQASLIAADADAKETAVSEMNITSIRDQIIEWNALADAQRAAAAAAVEAKGTSYGQVAPAKVNNRDIFGPQVEQNPALWVDAQAQERVAARRAAAQAALESAAVGTAGSAPIAVHDNGQILAAQMQAADAKFQAAIEELSVRETPKLEASARRAGTNIIETTEATLMDTLVELSGTENMAPGFRARLAGVASRLNPFTGSAAMMTGAGVGADRNMSGGITAAGVASKTAAEDSAVIAANSEKAGIAWGRVAGSVGMLAMGGMMISSMADGSGNIATNLMQGALAFSMLAPVVGNIVKKFTEMRAAQAAMTAESVAGQSLMGAGFTKIKNIGVGAFTAIGNGVKFMFTNPLGIALTVLSAIAIAYYTINQQMTKLATAQDNINKSTASWSSILGYTSKDVISADGSIAKGGNAYIARANAVKDLAKSNQSLVDSLAAAKDAANGMDKVYNMAMNEALKVKVDGGTATQAHMAFEVALQAAGLNQGTIDQLNIKYNKINLDDPGQLASQLNDQIALALKPQDNQDAQGGWLEQHWNNFFGQKSGGALGRLLGGNGYSGLSDAAKAAASQAGQAVYDSIAAGLKTGDKSQIDTAVTDMDSAINTEFADGFGRLRADGNNADTFKKLSITTMTQLRQAMLDATDAQKKGTASDVQKKLLGAMGDIQKSDAFQGFQDTWKGMLKSLGQADGLSGKGLDDFVNKTMNSKQVEDMFVGSMTTGAGAASALGDAYQQAADGAGSLADAMDTTGALISPTQMTKEMQDAYGGTIQSYVGQMNAAWTAQEQAAQKAIQASGDAKVKGLQDSQKDQDQAFSAQDKAITEHYKKLGAQYDANVKAKQNEAKAETDAIQKQLDALKKSDTTRQDLFNNEMTRLQRMAAAQTNNIDFNAALNSGNLDEAARIYSNNQATTQQNMLDDQQKAADDASKAQQDALSQQIQNINDSRDAYVQSQQDKKAALSDFETAEHDALTKQKQAYDDTMAAQITASQTATTAAIQNASDMATKHKAAIDQMLAAITAFVPQSVDQVHAQIKQIDGAYGTYGNKLQNDGQDWSKIIATDLTDNINKAANTVRSDVAWTQLGSYITNAISASADFSIDDALKFLQTGVWPTKTVQAPFIGPVAPGHSRGTQSVVVNKAHGGWVPGDLGPRYTGPGTKFQPAGIVHAGEFVFPQEAVQRIGVKALNDIAFSPMSRNGIGFSDGGLVPGFAGGGIVPLGLGTALTKYGVLYGSVMKAVTQKIMDTAVIEDMTGMGDLSGVFSGAINGGSSGGQTWPILDKIRQRLFPSSVLTSAYRPGAHDFHGLGEAIDIGVAGNLQSGLMPIAERLAQLFPNSTELIHNPNGSIKNGKQVSPSFWGAPTWAQHANHVHWAMTPEALASAGMGAIGAAGAPSSLTGNQALVQQMAGKYGWGAGQEWNSLYSLLMKESGFRNTAQNPTSSAYGMFQFLDEIWRGYGMSKTSDPTKQTEAGLAYVRNRYGDPIHAWAHELKYNWYDQGGWLKNGGIGINQSGKPEPVFTDNQWSIMKSLVGSSVNNISAYASGIDSESGRAYNIDKVNIDMTGAMINGQVDFEQGVYNALVKLDDKMGRSRTVS